MNKPEALLQIVDFFVRCAPRNLDVRVLRIDGKDVPKGKQLVKKGRPWKR